MPGSKLLLQIQEISDRAELVSSAVAVYDYETAVSFSLRGDRSFHAASTIKVALLLAVLRAVDQGRISLQSRLHVRNRFKSVVDDSVYRLAESRDGDSSVHKHIGRTMAIEELAKAMIVRSSNLATNVLFEFLGKAAVDETLKDAGVEGIVMHRGVEDEPAFEQGLNNEVTADGLMQLLRLPCERSFLSAECSDAMIAILLAQEFNSMIPAKLPKEAKVAHKTGEISTVTHDAGIVYLPDRKPYVVAILTEGSAASAQRVKAVAAISGAVYNFLMPKVP